MTENNPYGIPAQQGPNPYAQPQNAPQGQGYAPPQNTPPAQDYAPPQGAPSAEAYPGYVPHASHPGLAARYSAPRERRDPLTVILIQYFLGWLGIHKMYLGHTGLGFFYAALVIGGSMMGAIIPFFGFFIQLASIVAIVLFMIVDIKTVNEQVERSAAGEVFTVGTQLDLVKKFLSRA